VLTEPRANDLATSQEGSKNEPDLSYLQNLPSSVTITHLMNTFIRTVLIPLGSTNITVSRNMDQKTAQAMERMEEKINSIMQRTIDVALTWATKLLARQLKTDFRPKDDTLSGGSAWLEQLQTPVSILSSSALSNELLTKLWNRRVLASLRSYDAYTISLLPLFHRHQT